MNLGNNVKTDAVCVNKNNNQAAGLRVKTRVKAGAITSNHNQIQVRDSHPAGVRG